ncbi:MAG: hypothetical protein CMA77_01065 [Euryarchaeota archaeon]|mgnify:CR=1 FL=1|nr:hypothetical protein [Euryarchaeota archaeon]
MATEWEGTPCLSNKCSKCCRETEMPLSKSDIIRLEAAGFNQSYFSVVMLDNTVQLKNSDEYNACIFLETDSSELDASGTCQVWDIRPEGCRIYPLVLDDSNNQFMDELCPHRDAFPEPPIGLRGRLLVLAQSLDENNN